MDKVLIYRDTLKIEMCRAVAVQSVTHLQDVYNRFKPLGISVTTPQMENIRARLNVKTETRRNKSDARQTESVCGTDIENIVREMITAKMELPEISSFPMKREKITELLDLPASAISELEAAFIAFDNFARFNSSAYMPELCTVEGDTVVLIADYETVISEQYSHYAVTPRQIEIAGHLKNVRDTLNILYKNLISERVFSVSSGKLPDIHGLKVIGNEYHLDERYISSINH